MSMHLSNQISKRKDSFISSCLYYTLPFLTWARCIQNCICCLRILIINVRHFISLDMTSFFRQQRKRKTQSTIRSSLGAYVSLMWHIPPPHVPISRPSGPPQCPLLSHQLPVASVADASCDAGSVLFVFVEQEPSALGPFTQWRS